MKRTTMLAAAIASVLVPAVAAAQPRNAYPGYYAQPPGPSAGYLDRTGRMWLGGSVGLGYMDSKGGPIQCANCDYQPASLQGAVHIGGFLNPRLALMLELQANGQVVDDRIEGNVTLGQGAAMAAAQYWVSPKIWIKGGLGLAHLSYSYNDAYGSAEAPIADGGALLGAAGIELLQSYNYSIDLQGRLIIGTYDGINDQISSGSIGVGINWF